MKLAPTATDWQAVVSTAGPALGDDVADVAGFGRVITAVIASNADAGLGLSPSRLLAANTETVDLQTVVASQVVEPSSAGRVSKIARAKGAASAALASAAHEPAPPAALPSVLVPLTPPPIVTREGSTAKSLTGTEDALPADSAGDPAAPLSGARARFGGNDGARRQRGDVALGDVTRSLTRDQR